MKIAKQKRLSLNKKNAEKQAAKNAYTKFVNWN